MGKRETHFIRVWRLDISTISSSAEGAFSQDISEDGNIVVGNFNTGSGAFITPCKWVKNSEGKYVIEFLTVPENMKTDTR